MKPLFHKRKTDILNGSIPQQIMLFLFPVLIGYLLEQAYSAVDAMILGSISKNAIAAIGGSAVTIINVAKNFISGICSAVTILVAQNYGRGNFEKAKEVIRSGMFLAVIFGGILSILVIAIAPMLLRMMSVPQELIYDSMLYMYFYMGSIIFYFIYSIGISIIRATGDSKRPVYFTLLSCVTKIALDLLLVYVFDLGVLGTCIATFFSHIICAIAVLIIFGLTDDNYHYTFKEFGFEKNSLLQLLKIGLPIGLQSSLFAIANLYIQIKINAFGTDTIAAYSAFNSIDNYFWCFSNSLAAAVMTIASQNYGNKNIKRVRKTALWGMIIDAVAGILFGLTFYIYSTQLSSLYSNDANVINECKQMLHMVVSYYFIYSFTESFAAVLKSVGAVMLPMYICLIFVCGVRITYLFTMNFTNSAQVLFCYPLSWIATAVAFTIAIFTNKHLKLKNE